MTPGSNQNRPTTSSHAVRALITGGAGFIGRQIAEAWTRRGDEAVILDNLDPRVHGPGKPHIPEGARFIHGDILNTDTLRKALDDVEVVFHEAAMVGLGHGARDAEDYETTNVIGTLRLIREIARRDDPPRLVLASTMALYGEGAYECPTCNEPRNATRTQPQLEARRWDPECNTCGSPLMAVAVTEEHPGEPATVYAVSKLNQEHTARVVCKETGVPFVALRYHNVYGAHMPRDTPYAGVAALFKSRVLAGKPPLVHEDGTQLRDFIRVEDIAAANLLAAEAPLEDVDGEAFNIGTGRPQPIIELARELAKHHKDLEVELSGTYRHGDARHVFADTTKAERVLGFKARVGFEEGVRRFLEEPAREPPRTPARTQQEAPLG